jgi:hypothetical protein
VAVSAGRKGGRACWGASPGTGDVNVLNHSKTERARELLDHSHSSPETSVTAFKRHAASGIEPSANPSATTRNTQD